MELIKPTAEYGESYMKAVQEFEDEGRTGFWNHDRVPASAEEYIERTKKDERGEDLPENWVPSTTYWLVDEGEFIGHINIRHELNDNLKQQGGHIGYAVRPSERGKGYGKKLLELGLEKAKNEIGIKNILLTCDTGNTPSLKLIEGTGAKFENEVEGDNGPKRRYWLSEKLP